MIERVYVLASGLRFACYLSGPAAAPPLVLLHALGEQASSWDAVRAEFDSNYRVIAPDLRGHGDSDWPGRYSCQLMCEDVIAVLDQLGLAEVCLVGHSMGGVVGYLVAEQQPDRVERLIIEDACPAYDRPRPQHVQPEQALPFDWPVVVEISGQASVYDAACWDGLSTITAPTLLITGGPESHIPQAKLDEVAARIPDCQLVEVGGGHHVHVARPAEFNAAVAEFLQTAGKSAGTG